jgi:hypothetical protein
MTPADDNSTAQQASVQTNVNDDLAKALASVQAGSADSMGFETVGEPAMAAVPAAPPLDSTSPTPAPAPAPVQDDAEDTSTEAPEYSTPPASIDHSATNAPADAAMNGGAGNADSIEQIKISALQELRPLMQHIELTPEERFEKYLMMLRASDDPSLIEPTYGAAQQISSEKLKAQALLDVINEINYLTSQQLVA